MCFSFSGIREYSYCQKYLLTAFLNLIYLLAMYCIAFATLNITLTLPCHLSYFKGCVDSTIVLLYFMTIFFYCS